jgi:hypothetical protein
MSYSIETGIHCEIVTILNVYLIIIIMLFYNNINRANFFCFLIEDLILKILEQMIEIFC